MASDTNAATAAKRKLPIGIQTFRTIREEKCYYVDKTEHIKQLAEGGGRYLLSRPRRFGKSLLLDTLKELFEGTEPLFRGLAIHAHWDWSVRHPVVRLSFGGGDFKNAHTRNNIADYEGYYASVFHAYLMALEMDVRVEDSSAAGRLDMALLLNGHVTLFEFKVVESASAGTAIAQLRQRDYAAKYRGRGEPIHLLGIEFSRESRNIVAFDVEQD